MQYKIYEQDMPLPKSTRNHAPVSSPMFDFFGCCDDREVERQVFYEHNELFNTRELHSSYRSVNEYESERALNALRRYCKRRPNNQVLRSTVQEPKKVDKVFNVFQQYSRK